ncbi:MAG TPA: DUF86 domain-containing protein [Methanotrichaceae archaeon]|nr:DUF86 domain-containing protein [Methanotrichaceae archaeon]HQF16012.1 DUF86 domain-containing protein [Methanotrichaceae archaeon]HQI90640.1 DUF86 domain-containing protein [Methanotrichaceae archaeon]HQJ28079.1 DUF86 domain-containing protein [Methanotrichaceae archaeon]
MSKETLPLLDHILQSIELVERYTDGRTEKDFLQSVELSDRVIRRLEIIGEVVKNLPEDLKADHPKIKWREIAGMRDVLIHRYFEVDLELTWQVVQRDIPELKKVIIQMKEGLRR